MIEVLEMKDEDILGFKVNGRIEKEELKDVFKMFEDKMANNGKVKFYTEIEEFGIKDMSLDAVKEDIKFWFQHPGMLPNFEKVALVTDKDWVKRIFEVECALIPTLEGETFSLDKKDEAIKWLKTDQREKSRIDLTFSELVETSTLKFAGGFAIGLLTAGLFGKKQRKTLGTAVLFGTVASGIPLGLKILNNNRQLLKSIDCEDKMLAS